MTRAHAARQAMPHGGEFSCCVDLEDSFRFVSQKVRTMSNTQTCVPAPDPDQCGLSRWERLHRNLNYDFCPWANRWVYWLKHPLWILVLATAAATVCAICLSPGVWALAAALGCVLVVGSVWPWIAMRGVECELEFLSERVREGETVRVRLVLKNRCPWPVWGLTIQRGFATEGTEGDSVALSHLNGWSEQEYLWEYRPAARGVYPTCAPRIETAFPFGLISCRRPLNACNELIVWPRGVALESLPDSSELDPSGERCNDRRAGDFGEVLGTRPFRAGDSLRRVHWAQTARLGTTIVTERQAPLRTAVVVAAELRRKHHRRGEWSDSLELSIRLLTSVCESLIDQHCHVECLVGTHWHVPGRSPRERIQWLDALAHIPAGGFGDDDRLDDEPRIARRGSRRIEILPAALCRTMVERQPEFAQDRRLIVLGEGSERSALNEWISLPVADAALDELPQLWRRACRER